MSVELDLLRPALELAIRVARAGLSATPPIDPPRSLAQFLQFRRLPQKALAAARHCLDEDEEFRTRVAEAADEDALGAAAYAFVTRPGGWEDIVAAEVQRVERERSADDAARDERTVEKLAAQVKEFRRRVAETEAKRNSAEQRARAARDRVEALLVSLEQQEASLLAAEAARQRAVRELKDTEKRLAERTDEVKALHAEIATLRAAVAQSDAVAATESAEVDAVAASRAADTAIVEALREQWDSAAPAIAEIARLLSVPDATPAHLLKAAQTAPSRPREEPPGPRRRKKAGADRVPPRLPNRIAPGTAEAARWYLSRPGVIVFVDGYNVTMLAWPDLSATEQRVALERVARRLQAQHGCRIVLVFDGDDEDGGRESRSAVGSPVRILYTARTVEADDEILAQLDERPEAAVVVSNDRRVQTGAEERGAVVLTSNEFLALGR